MNIYSLDGAESVGKSTLLDQVAGRVGYDMHVVPDLARKWYEENRANPRDLSKVEHADKQLDILEMYLREVDQAQEQGKDMLVDSSLVTMYAYSIDCMRGYYIRLMRNLLLSQSDKIKTIIIPPILPLNKEGIRFNDEKYRMQIHKRIMQTVGKYDIDYLELSSRDLSVRTDDAVQFIRPLE